MNRHTLALLVGMAVAVSSLPDAAVAQQAARTPHMAELQEQLAAAKTRLHLTSDQEERLRALLQEEAEKLRVVESRYGTDTSLRTRRAKLKEARAVQQDFRARLGGILSPEQMAEWDKMRDEARGRVRERRQQH